jgi:hypothetical protein
MSTPFGSGPTPPGGPGSPAPPGGGFGPPPGGGEAVHRPPGEMNHIPFGPDEEAVIGATARFMFIASMITASAVVVGVIGLMLKLVAATATSDELPLVATYAFGCFPLFSIMMSGAIAFFLYRGSRALKLVVTTDRADQFNLIEAFRAIRNVFIVQVTRVALVLVGGCAGWMLIALFVGIWASFF